MSPRAADRLAPRFGGPGRAYAATMVALGQAVATKDLYARGHGERVSRGEVMIGRESGMLASRLEAVSSTGMLTGSATII